MKERIRNNKEIMRIMYFPDIIPIIVPLQIFKLNIISINYNNCQNCYKAKTNISTQAKYRCIF